MTIGFGPRIIFIVVGVATVLLLISALLQWLWNITMPKVFKLSPITFWQAFRLLLIAGILFGGSTGIRLIN